MKKSVSVHETKTTMIYHFSPRVFAAGRPKAVTERTPRRGKGMDVVVVGTHLSLSDGRAMMGER